MDLDEKYKEMAALGAAVGSNCLLCLEWHYKHCIEIGFTKEELKQAIDMALMVKSVPGDKIIETAKKLEKQYFS